MVVTLKVNGDAFCRKCNKERRAKTILMLADTKAKLPEYEFAIKGFEIVLSCNHRIRYGFSDEWMRTGISNALEKWEETRREAY